MPIPLTCPHCGLQTNVPEELMGTSGPCAQCGKTITVPAAATASAVALPREQSRGTLVIILVVLAIVGAFVVCGALSLFSLARTAYDGTRKRANINAAEVQVTLFKNQLELYKLTVKSYPSTDQGLQALQAAPADLADPDSWEGPYLEGFLPLDPWDNPYQYQQPGRFNPDKYDLWSFGPDGTNGTDDDVGNWNQE